ncbi:MAG: hypothetical protein JW722_03335 [Demequinaceae bacterium]|nr:hypothetical protein [Demequinaceae bacterium]
MSVVTVERPHLSPSVRALNPSAIPSNPYVRPRRALGDPTPLACTVAKTALEVVLGGTGLDQLNRWVTPEIRTSLARQGALALRSGRGRQAAVAIKRIRVYRVSEAAAETSIVADDGVRVRAVAARFEDVGGRWQATVLDIG